MEIYLHIRVSEERKLVYMTGTGCRYFLQNIRQPLQVRTFPLHGQ